MLSCDHIVSDMSHNALDEVKERLVEDVAIDQELVILYHDHAFHPLWHKRLNFTVGNEFVLFTVAWVNQFLSCCRSISRSCGIGAFQSFLVNLFTLLLLMIFLCHFLIYFNFLHGQDNFFDGFFLHLFVDQHVSILTIRVGSPALEQVCLHV